VGTAIAGVAVRGLRSVHPHVRGDGFGPTGRLAGAGGSPPRAWGRLQDAPEARLVARFTPTCVGTARRSSRSRLPGAVHPHVRGDGHARQQGAQTFPGSPPRAWGRRRLATDEARRPRFTPTCVGTAWHYLLLTRRITVHPHVRGDGYFSLTADGVPYGSPPRAWGRLVRFRVVAAVNRFTPTCVGTAVAGLTAPPASSVHPHVRGDGVPASPTVQNPVGSPPRAWGRPKGD